VAMCRKDRGNGNVLGREPASPNKLLHRVHRRLARFSKRADTTYTGRPMLKDTEFGFGRPIVANGTPTLGRDVAHPVTVRLMSPPSLDDATTMATRVGVLAQLSIILSMTRQLTEVLSVWSGRDLHAPRKRFMALCTRKRAHNRLARPACITRPSHRLLVYRQRDAAWEKPAHVAAYCASHGRSTVSSTPVLIVSGRAERKLGPLCLPGTHIHGYVTQSAGARLAASRAPISPNPKRGDAPARSAQLLIQLARRPIANVITASLAEKNSSSSRPFSPATRPIPRLITLWHMIVRSSALRSRDRDQFIWTWAVRQSAADLDTAPLTARFSACCRQGFSSCGKVTRNGTVVPLLWITSGREVFSTLQARSFVSSLRTGVATVQRPCPRDSERSTTAPAQPPTVRGETEEEIGRASILYGLRFSMGILTLRMTVLRPATPMHRNQLIWAWAVRPDTANINTAALTICVYSGLHPFRHVRFQATSAGAISTRALRCRPCLEDSPALRAWSFPLSLPALDCAVPLQGPRNRERCSAATAGAYQNQLSSILGVSKSALL